MNETCYDSVVLGCGEGGKFLAWHLAGAGERLAVVEDRYLGGSCPNIACLPSKNIIHSAAVAETVRTSALFGTHADGLRIEMAEVQARKRAMVDGLITMHRDRFAASGAELVWARGTFVGERRVAAALADGSSRTLRGDKVFLDLGAFASKPHLPGLQAAAALTHVELLDLETTPGHLLVLGGGYVALELAQAMRRLGSAVTILERSGRLLPREDPDVSAGVTALLQDEGISIVVDAVAERVSGRSGERVALHGTVGGSPGWMVEGTHLLVSLGKSPNTAGIGLDLAGVALTTSGYVRVNERLETTARNVWALGDCGGGPAFTHVSFEDFRTIRDNLAGGDRSTRGRLIPSCLFIEPELARVGLNEMEARASGVPYRLAELPVAAVPRTRTTGESRGKLKVLIGADDRILGFTAFAPHAGELLPPVQLAMSHGLPFTAMRDLIIAHPTYAEGLVALFAAVPAA